MKIYVLIILSFMIFQLVYAQHEEFEQVSLPTTRNQIRIDTFNVYSRTDLEEGIQWVLAIKPRWTNIAGINKNGEIYVAYADSTSDGSLMKSYFYSSETNSNNFIIISPYGFDDGTSGLKIFEYKDQNIKHLGDLNLLAKGYDDITGTHGYYPEEQLSIIKTNNQLKLRFSEGEYIYRKNFKENIIKGPFEVVYQNNEFAIRPN